MERTVPPGLPSIEARHLTANFSAVEDEAGAGGSAFQAAIQHWNRREFDQAFLKMGEALELGLTPTNACHANATRGHVLIDRGDLGGAVREYLACLEVQTRSVSSTWESAERLAIIYDEAGRFSEADALGKLADKANTRGLELDLEYQDRVRRLVQGFSTAIARANAPADSEDAPQSTAIDPEEPSGESKGDDRHRADAWLAALNSKIARSLEVEAFPPRCCICLAPAETDHRIDKSDSNDVSLNSNLVVTVPVCRTCAVGRELNPTAWPPLVLFAFFGFGFAGIAASVALDVPEWIGEILLQVFIVGLLILGAITAGWYGMKPPPPVEIVARKDVAGRFIEDVRFKNVEYQRLFDDAKGAAARRRERLRIGSRPLQDQLRALQRRFSALSSGYARTGFVIGGDAAHRVIATIAGVCDRAATTLGSGMSTRSSTRDVSNGLRRLVDDARRDTGVIAIVLNPEGVGLFNDYLSKLEQLAEAIDGKPAQSAKQRAPATKLSKSSEKRTARAPTSAGTQADAERSSLPPGLTTGTHLSGTRHQVSTPASMAGRSGKCRDCGTVVTLTDAKVVCLDWDGVDAYHFYCPRCYRGTQDPHYYTGQLLGSNDRAVIDQHSWERES